MVRLKENEVSAEQIQHSSKPPMIGYEQSTKIVSCQIKGGELITQLDDERKKIIPVASLTKWQVLEEHIKPEQLKKIITIKSLFLKKTKIKYEIRNEGRIIYFPDIDEVLPSWIIIRGLHSACRD